jgi:type I restriction enzyme S subunit
LEERRTNWPLLSTKRYSEPTVDVPDDLPEIPASWVWATVDSISLRVVDGVHKTPKYVSDGVPFVTVRNLTAGRGISFDDVSFITESDHHQFIQRADPSRGDLLVTKDGTLGVVRAVRTERVFSIFVSVAMIKPVSTLLTDYLEIALSSPQVQAQMTGTGSGLQHIHLRDLKADCVPLPPLEEQNEIVRRVEALFKLADTIEKRVAAAQARADKLTQSILAKAFRGELVPTEAELARQQNREYEPASVLLERIGASKESIAVVPKRRSVRTHK